LNIAVIPARGGSKRIPLKNIRKFAGKPIIAWSIEAALESQLFDRVVVSTDNNDIAATAKNYGAEIPFTRPRELSDDFTDTQAVVKHTIEWFRKQGSVVRDVCCIYATAPFIQVAFLRDAYKKLISSTKSFAFSVTTYPFPVQRAIKIDGNGVVPLWPQYIDKRSQDLDEAYHDAGQFYWGKAEAFLKEVPLFSQRSIPIVLPRHLVQDIDTIEDWKRAELMFAALVTSGEIT